MILFMKVDIYSYIYFENMCGGCLIAMTSGIPYDVVDPYQQCSRHMLNFRFEIQKCNF